MIARDRAGLRDWLRAACRDAGVWPPPVFGIRTTRTLLSFELEPMHKSFYTPLMTRLTRRYPRLVHTLTWENPDDTSRYAKTALEIWQAGRVCRSGYFAALLGVTCARPGRRTTRVVLFESDARIADIRPFARVGSGLCGIQPDPHDIGPWRVLEALVSERPNTLHDPVRNIVLHTVSTQVTVMSDITAYGRIGAMAWLNVDELPQRFPELAGWCEKWRAYEADAEARAREAAARYNRYARRMKVLYGSDWDAIPF
ncbi:hypothetical protein OQ496_13300 [Acetobacter suratthaniensis]|uniref:Uncharacterized protein n=1 Tax=Acetobacter suratthaniensis TaxID=1502841 RepID=A0ABS3LPU4_9PROT|nr:hypothetical protein [Acetobacter suratthaniensis]MBO1329393.1 hypothetical protein [Acetobacter suratthaniensis]MCX2567423.1 hypothetical protein [Acetobacter suratthaniensis]